MPALREVLAWLDVKVRGTEQVVRANNQVNALRDNMHRALSAPGGDDMFSQAMRRAVISGGAQKQALDQTAAAARNATPALAGFASAWPQIAAAVAGAGAVIAGVILPIKAMLEEVIGLGDELQATSQQVGINTRELQMWRFIAERGNVDAGALVGSMSRLQRTAFSSPRAFRALGVSVRGANGQVKSAGDLFRETGVALSAIQDPAERAARAQQIFGKSGRELLPIFAEGEQGIEALIARFDELGGGLSDEVVEGAAGADDAMVDFRLTMTSLKGVLAANVLPAITAIISGLAEFVAKAVEVIRTSSIVETTLGVLAIAIGVLGLVAASAFAPVWVPLLALGLILGGLVLVIEDVVTAFMGGDSVFGSFVESILASMGVTVTFTGIIERLGIVWLHVKAQALDAVASILGGVDQLQQALGITLFDGVRGAAADASSAASMARSEGATATKVHALGEQGRRDERAEAAALRIRELGEEASVNVRKKPRGEAAGGGRGRRGDIHQRNTIVVQGAGDPDEVARRVDAHSRRMLREANDTLPEPEPA